MMDKNEFPHPEIAMFKSKHRPYYIAVSEYTQNSAGYMAPYHLCHLLNTIGYEAYVAAQKSIKNLRTPLLTQEIIDRHKFENRKVIAIYDEGMWGNVLKGDIVVRFSLTNMGALQTMLLGENELQFFWSPYYASPNEINPNILCIPLIDNDIFNRDGVDDSQRTGFAYYAYKYFRYFDFKVTLPEKLTRKGINLSKDIKMTKQEIASILKSVKVLYLYDNTQLTAEAALCGCPTVFINSKFNNAKVIYGTSDLSKYYDHCIDEDNFDPDKEWEFTGVALKDYLDTAVHPLAKNMHRFISVTQSTSSISKQYSLEPTKHSNLDRKIYIYGLGVYGEIVQRFYNLLGIKINGYIISDQFIHNYSSYEADSPIVSFSQFCEMYDESCTVILGLNEENTRQVTPHLDEFHIKYIGFRENFGFDIPFSDVLSIRLNLFFKTYKKIYIYGAGNAAKMVVNVLTTANINIIGVIVSDKYSRDSTNAFMGLPVCSFSDFIKNDQRDVGVVLSMTYIYAKEVLPDLRKYKINYISPMVC